MSRELINRYQPGGDLYQKLSEQYGIAAALRVAQAAMTGERQRVTDAIAEVRSGPRLDDSTLSIFSDLVTTDPLGAPLDSANQGIGNVVTSAVKGIFSNPWVLLLIAALVFHLFGGSKWLLRRGRGALSA